MKNWKKILIMAAVPLMFLSCDEDDKHDDRNESDFKGTVTVNNGAFTMNNIKVETEYTDATSGCTIEIDDVSFSDKMPVTMDMTIKGVKFSVENGDTILTGANLNPEIEIGDRDMFNLFPIETLTGRATKSGLVLDINGKYQDTMSISIHYDGIRFKY